MSVMNVKDRRSDGMSLTDCLKIHHQSCCAQRTLEPVFAAGSCDKHANARNTCRTSPANKPPALIRNEPLLSSNKLTVLQALCPRLTMVASQLLTAV